MKAKRLLSVIATLIIALLLSGTATVAGPFIDNGDGTVTDESTGFMWIEKSWHFFGPDAFLGSTACGYCDDLGQDSWRIPIIEELQTIVDYTSVSPTIDSDVFDPPFRKTFGRNLTRAHSVWVFKNMHEKVAHKKYSISQIVP